VRVGFDRLEPRILPEMAVKVAFRDTAAAPAAGAPRLVLLPKAAVQAADGRDIVFVVAGGRAERRAVTVTSTVNDEVTLSAGVAAGEKVILNPPAGLADGASVREGNL
jgi:HlyD family secretion protein